MELSHTFRARVRLAATRGVCLSREWLAVLAQMLLAFSLTSATAHAATIAVDSAGDDMNLGPNGNCTIREAIEAANTNTAVDACIAGAAGQDLIELPAATLTLAIAGANEDANATGDLDVLEPVEIRGAGSATTTLDATGLGDRVLQIADGVKVTLVDLTVTGGRALGGASETASGGAIWNGGDLTLVRVTASDNQAIGGDGNEQSQNGGTGQGGALYNAPTASLTLDTAVVENNVARGGNGATVCCSFSCSCTTSGPAGHGYAGAIESPGALTIVRSTIQDNLAVGGSSSRSTPGSAQAGALHLGGMPATVRGTLFARNSASMAGRFNLVAPPNAVAGAILVGAGTNLVLDESLLSENLASGGVSSIQAGSGTGGAMTVNAGATVQVTNSTFAKNHAIGGDNTLLGSSGGAATGGAIDTAGTLALQNVTFTDNDVTSGAAPTPGVAQGAALYSRASTTIVNSIVAASRKKVGGGAAADEGCAGTTPAVSQGGNMESPVSTCLFFGLGDQRSLSPAALDLQPLADNGGATWTAALGASSVAVDAGRPFSCPAFDQRHYPRNGTCDSGAFEVGAAPCTDADQDGYSVEGGACGAVDCNDANASVNPGATEVPLNGIDDDCNPLTPFPPSCASVGRDGAPTTPASAEVVPWIALGWVVARLHRVRRRSALRR